MAQGETMARRRDTSWVPAGLLLRSGFLAAILIFNSCSTVFTLPSATGTLAGGMSSSSSSADRTRFVDTGASLLGGGSKQQQQQHHHHQHQQQQQQQHHERPYFDDVGPRNVTAVVGQSALLQCRVKNPGDRTVSWMRKRDLHILTSSIHTYTGDARFGVKHPEHSDDWDLQIEYVQKRDAGVYECQVNTEPKINWPITLNVEEASPLAATHPGPKPSLSKDAQANIGGSQDVYVKKGSTISLTCTVNVHSTPPSSVLWYHGHSVVDFDSPRGGISLETEKTESGTTSKLLITKASLTDSGNYTCVPSNATPASVFVHVLNGEHPAAMQTSGAQSLGVIASILAIFSSVHLSAR